MHTNISSQFLKPHIWCTSKKNGKRFDLFFFGLRKWVHEVKHPCKRWNNLDQSINLHIWSKKKPLRLFNSFNFFKKNLKNLHNMYKKSPWGFFIFKKSLLNFLKFLHNMYKKFKKILYQVLLMDANWDRNTYVRRILHQFLNSNVFDKYQNFEALFFYPLVGVWLKNAPNEIFWKM